MLFSCVYLIKTYFVDARKINAQKQKEGSGKWCQQMYVV